MASPATLPSGTESLNDKLAGHCNTASLQEYPNIVHALDCLKMILDRERSRQRHGESPTSEPVIFTIEESPQAKDRRRSLRERADHVLAASEGAEVLPIDIESTGSLVQVRECMKEIVDQLRVLLPVRNVRWRKRA